MKLYSRNINNKRHVSPAHYSFIHTNNYFRVGSPLVDQKNWTKMVERLLNYYVEDLAEATSHGVDITDVTEHEYESGSKWDFWGSLFYAGTVFTTIGIRLTLRHAIELYT